MNKNLFKLLTKYFFIGILAATIELLVFNFLIQYFNYVIANSIAYSFGIITSFTLNKFFNFKVKDKTIIRFGRFLIVNIVGLFISNLILIYFSGLLPLIELKILSMPIVIFFQFITNYLWTFKK